MLLETQHRAKDGFDNLRIFCPNYDLEPKTSILQNNQESKTSISSGHVAIWVKNQTLAKLKCVYFGSMLAFLGILLSVSGKFLEQKNREFQRSFSTHPFHVTAIFNPPLPCLQCIEPSVDKAVRTPRLVTSPISLHV